MSAAVLPEILEPLEVPAPGLVLVRSPRPSFEPIKQLVLDWVSSPLTKCAYGACLDTFLRWLRG